MIATAIVPLGVTWGFALVRVYVRVMMLKIWRVEDWLFIASQVSLTPMILEKEYD